MTWASIIAGLLAFILFVLYDINSVRFESRLLKPAFFLGFILLTAATVMMFAAGWQMDGEIGNRQIVFLIIAAGFLLMLIYTLFFALPFSDTYVKEAKPRVCSHGVYALCRHPGVLWFTGMYACFALAMPTLPVILGGTVFSLCNVLYVVMQDMWTFPNYFIDYQSYQKRVPFLIPTVKSGKACIRTLKAGRKHV